MNVLSTGRLSPQNRYRPGLGIPFMLTPLPRTMYPASTQYVESLDASHASSVTKLPVEVVRHNGVTTSLTPSKELVLPNAAP